MTWSLTPSWAKEYPVKWGSYNARLDREKDGRTQYIFETPSFKNAFRKNQFCVVPIQGAIESCYWGEAAGKIVAFQRKDQKNFFAAGLTDTWTDPKSGEIHESVTLMTDAPYEYFFKNGHDRSILAFQEERIEELLCHKERKVHESLKFIRANRRSYEWTFQIERELKEGWQKRAPSPEEIEAIGQNVFQR